MERNEAIKNIRELITREKVWAIESNSNCDTVIETLDLAIKALEEPRLKKIDEEAVRKALCEHECKQCESVFPEENTLFCIVNRHTKAIVSQFGTALPSRDVLIETIKNHLLNEEWHIGDGVDDCAGHDTDLMERSIIELSNIVLNECKEVKDGK